MHGFIDCIVCWKRNIFFCWRKRTPTQVEKLNLDYGLILTNRLKLAWLSLFLFFSKISFTTASSYNFNILFSSKGETKKRNISVDSFKDCQWLDGFPNTNQPTTLWIDLDYENGNDFHVFFLLLHWDTNFELAVMKHLFYIFYWPDCFSC